MNQLCRLCFAVERTRYLASYHSQSQISSRQALGILRGVLAILAFACALLARVPCSTAR